MSAFRVSSVHVVLMVDAATLGPLELRKDWRPVTWEHADRRHMLKRCNADPEAVRLAQILDNENAESLAHRYNEVAAERDRPRIGPAEMARTMPPLTVCEALSLVSCYVYQSCEHPAWRTSEAAEFCNAFRLAICSGLGHLADAPWGWTWADVAHRLEHPPAEVVNVTLADCLAATRKGGAR